MEASVALSRLLAAPELPSIPTSLAASHRAGCSLENTGRTPPTTFRQIWKPFTERPKILSCLPLWNPDVYLSINEQREMLSHRSSERTGISLSRAKPKLR
jgi:hypothetical protein